ncbi:unnamed protein product, partial [Ectocarpus sp. 12 AP-2014]
TLNFSWYWNPNGCPSATGCSRAAVVMVQSTSPRPPPRLVIDLLRIKSTPRNSPLRDDDFVPRSSRVSLSGVTSVTTGSFPLLSPQHCSSRDSTSFAANGTSPRRQAVLL